MKKICQRALLGLGLLSALASNAQTPPADWPQQPITLVMTFPAGSGVDVVARQVQEPLGKLLGQAIVIEYKPGAAGNIASEFVSRAKPDGYTLVFGTAATHGSNAALYKNLSFDVEADFVPVAQVVENDFAFAINPKIPAKDLQAFAAWCRENPQTASFGTPGPGSSPHFMGETLARALGVNMNHIPYRGNNFAITDMAGGHISSMISASTFVVAPHKAGQVRVLGITGRQRLPSLPDVPTFAEQGIAQLSISEGTWVMAPARTPAAVVEKLADAVIASLKTRPMQQVIQGQAEAAPLRPAALAQRMRQEFDQRGAGIRATGFTANPT